MSNLVEYKSRAGIAPSHGQQLELAPAEAAMAKVSLFMKANMRPTIVSIIEGFRPSAEAFAVATSKLADRHPALKGKFVQSSPEPTSVESTIVLTVDESLKVPVYFHDVSVASLSYEAVNDAWKSVWAEKIEKKPLTLNESIAQVDVISLITASPSELPKTAVLFTCEHAFADGMSLSVLAHELLSLLAGEDANLSASVDTLWSAPLEILSAPTSEDHGKERFASFVAFPRYTDMARFPPKNPEALPRQMSDTCGTFVTHAELNESETSELVALCKTHNCTVTSIVGVAMMQASTISLVALEASGTKVEGVTGNEAKVVLSCAADTRRLYTPPLSPSVLACHVSGVASFLQILDATRLDPDFLWSVAGEYRKHLAAVIAGEYPQFIAPFLHAAWSAPLTQATPELKPLNTSISNWGITPVQKEYGNAASGTSFRVLSVLPICTLSAFPFPTFLVNTGVGKLTVTCHTPSGPDGLEDDLNVTLVKDVMKILRSLLSTSA